jgi:hypothetical protein
MRVCRVAVFTALAGLLATGRASAAGVSLAYEVRYGPITLVEARATTRLDGERYESSNEMHTVGVIGLLFPWTAESHTSGAVHGAAFAPASHWSRGQFRGVDRSVAIAYGPDGAVSARVAPDADDDARDAVPSEAQQATIDPLTAGLAMATSECRGTLRIFDGRRRYDMQLTDQGDAAVPSRAAIYRGAAHRCRAVIVPFAGFARRDTAADERPTQLDTWTAVPRAGCMAVPVYLELSAPRGTLGIPLVSAEPLPADDAAAGGEMPRAAR